MRLFVLVACIAVFSAASVQAALVGHWDFEEQTGSTTSNLANPGVGDADLVRADTSDSTTVPVTTLWASGEGRNYITLFEENFEFAKVSSDAVTNITTGAITIAAWVKRQGGNMAAEPIFGKSTGTYGLTMYDSGGSGPGFAYAYAGGANQGTAAGAVPPDVWTHVAMTFDESISGSDNLFVYINGVPVGSKEAAGALADTAGVDFRIGGNRHEPTHWNWNSAYWNGGVDDVRLYDHALSGTEIAALAVPPEVPEPASLVMLACGLAMVVVRRV